MKTLLKGGTVYDGLGGTPYLADLLIDGSRIAEISDHISCPAGASVRVLDVSGKCVTPGFIDIHRHADAAVLREGFGEAELSQGLTSIVNGNCGLSVAPLSPEHAKERMKFLEPITGSLKDLCFEKMSDYMDAVKAAAPPLYCGMLIGTGSLLASVCGQGNHTPSDGEMKRMHGALEDAVASGVLGISMGLEYEPECFRSTKDMIRLLEPVKGSSLPLIMHVRSEGNALPEALREAIRLARALRLSLHISHIKCIGKKNWHTGSEQSLRILEEARGEGLDVSCDAYPYTAGSTQLLQLIPPAFGDGGMTQILKRLGDPAVRKEIGAALESEATDFDNFAALEGWENIFISSAKQKENQDCIGKSLEEIARVRGVTPLDAACDLLISEHGECAMIDRYGCEEDVRKFLSCPFVNIISDSLYADAGLPHPRRYGSFARVLETYVRKEKLLPLETAVMKMTSMPAGIVRLDRKGVLREGNDADLLVFELSRIRDRATFEHPRQTASGFEHIFVGGRKIHLSDIAENPPEKSVR